MPWYQMLPHHPISDVRSVVIERYQMGEYAVYQDGSQWQIMHLKEGKLYWPGDQEEKYVQLDPARLRQLRDQCRPQQRRSSGSPPADIGGLLRRYILSQDTDLAPTRLELCQTHPIRAGAQFDMRAVTAADSTDFYRDFESAEIHLRQTCEELKKMGWTAERLDQFWPEYLSTDHAQIRWLPNVVMWRAQNEVIFIEGRSGDDVYPGYHRIDTSAVEAAQAFVHYSRRPILYMFGDFSCATPTMILEMAEDFQVH